MELVLKKQQFGALCRATPYGIKSGNTEYETMTLTVVYNIV